VQGWRGAAGRSGLQPGTDQARLGLALQAVSAGAVTYQCSGRDQGQSGIAGIETMHMIRKGQMDCPAGQTMSAAQQFYSLAV